MTSRDRDRLEVMVIEAEGLLVVEGGAANPYVSVEVGDEKQRTSVESNTVDPVWDEEIMVFSETTSRKVEHVILMVKHHDPVGSHTDRMLGMVIVDTATALQAPGISTQEWFNVRKGPGMKTGDAPQGRVHVKITYFMNGLEALEVTAGDNDDDDEDDDSFRAPNVVTLFVEAGRNILPPGSSGVCDPIVSVKCGKGNKAKFSKAQRKTNNPKWHFEVQMANSDPSEAVIIEVLHSGTMSNKLIGQARLTMVEIAQAGESLTRWLSLLDERWGFTSVGRGEIVVTARWHYEKSFESKSSILPASFIGGKTKKLEREKQVLDALVEEYEYEDDNDDEPQDGEVPPEVEEERGELEEEQRAREEQALAARAEYQERIDAIRPGDYQLQVHVIEVSDLKGKDASGTSDPTVYATCLGHTKHTRVRKSVNSAVIDEVLYFNLQSLSRDQLMQATVQLRVLDANTFLRHSLIGNYQFDLLGIYVEKGHEVYRTWVGLQDTESKEDGGVQGFLKLSVTVLGPGDRQRIHDLAEEMQEELAKEAEAGRRGGLVLMGPAIIPQDLQFLVVYIFSAQDLPGFSAVGTPAVNAVVQVDFAGNPPVRTTAVRARGRDGLSPAFAQELWLPVMVPTHSTSIDLSVWHKEITGREVIAHTYFDLSEAPKIPEKSSGKRSALFGKKKKEYPGSKPKWVNLYGAPIGKGKGREAEIMNRYPSRGSAYRGRLLVSMRIENHPPAKLGNYARRRPMDFEVPPEMLPETVKYTLRALVLQGSDIPIFKFPNAQGVSKMRVVVKLGQIKLEFRAKTNRKGIIEWNQGEEVHMVELPADPAQLPDIFVYLVRDMPESKVSYARIPAVDVISQRFKGDPFWQELVADKTRQGLWAVGSDNFPGSLLIRLGLGHDFVARHNPWEEMQALSQESATPGINRPYILVSHSSAADRDDEEDVGVQAEATTLEATMAATLGLLGKKSPHCLRVHIFQCRSLPSSEASGLLDPYIKVRFMGRKKKTSHEVSTNNPCFYQTVEFHDMLPGDLRFAPEIRVEIWDKDFLGSNTHVAGCRFPMSAATVSRAAGARVPVPSWFQLRDTNGQPGVGEVLLSLQLIPKRTVHDKIPKAPNITPTFRHAFLEVITVGLRDLKPFGFQAVSQPYVQFEMTSGGERVSFTTHASKFPSGKNANFAERKIRSVLLPDDPLFAPQLCIKVSDKRMSGLNIPLVGTCSVNLAQKMPWNDEGYRPPQSHSFNSLQKDEVATPSPRDRHNRKNQVNGGVEENAEEQNRIDRERLRNNSSPRSASSGGGGGGLIPVREGSDGGNSADTNRSPARAGTAAVGRTQSGGWRGRGEGKGRGQETVNGDRGRAAVASRPANFGVGAVEVDNNFLGDGGWDDRDNSGNGLELPPIEEDMAYEEEMYRRRSQANRHRARGPNADGRTTRPAAAGENQGIQEKASTHQSKAPAWYEQLFHGGSKAFGVIDSQEEDRWTLDELAIDFPHEWASSEFLEGRNWWLKKEGGGNEIEHFLQKAPFENYPLFLGAEKFKSGVRFRRQMSRRRVGLLKGLVVVTENPPNVENSEFVDMNLLRIPRSYCCRLYVVKGLHLQPKDLNGSADPYIKFKIGKLRVDDGKDKENIKKNTLDPEFFRSFEFPVVMPGESQLKLKIYDYDRFGSDEMIGETVIDLEDRWFSRNWHDLEKQDPVASEKRQTQGPFKPLESRDLSVPTSSNPQGQVIMWLDMLTLPEGRRFPRVPMEPPASLKVEVRVVCWRSEDVLARNDFSGLRDLYCRLWMETDSKKKRDTDTHWRCKNGKGCWNYRIKFDVDLPLKSPEQGRLAVQMWDRDVLSANDIIAETSIELYRWFLKVYREQKSTKPFLIVNEARKQKTHAEALAVQASGDVSRMPSGALKEASGEDFGDEERGDFGPLERLGVGEYDIDGAGQSSESFSTSVGEEENDGQDDNESEDFVGEDMPLLLNSTGEVDAAITAAANTPVGVPMEETEKAKKAKRMRQMEKLDDTDEIVDTIKEWFGVGKVPDDAQWLELTKRDPEAGTVERMGRLLISLELLPKDAADAQPVGAARNEPNQNPYLPPPAGRMKMSFNPFRLSMSLLGPKAFYKVLCCCLCISLAVVIALAGNYITTFESLFSW